jgi:hypothetical protein
MSQKNRTTYNWALQHTYWEAERRDTDLAVTSLKLSLQAAEPQSRQQRAEATR